MTDFQPTLPAELPFSDAEIAFMEESPPGLFPENQDSNFGYIIRKIFSDRVQEAIGQLNTIYQEKFVDTSTLYLDEWESTVGLPVNAGSNTTDQRRNVILNRLRKGAFTRAMRQSVVESFIQATFGVAPAFDPSGLALTGTGIPLFSGVNSLAGTYVIWESPPGTNILDNPMFDVDLAGTGTDPNITKTWDNTKSKFGRGSLKMHIDTGVGTVGQAFDMRSGAKIPVAASSPYTFSFYLLDGGSAADRSIQLKQQWFTAGGATITSTQSSIFPVASGQTWTRYNYTVSSPATAASVEFSGRLDSSPAVGENFWWDGVMVEPGSTLHDFTMGHPFYYEVRLLNTLGVDVVALTRELTRITPAGFSFSVIETSTL